MNIPEHINQMLDDLESMPDSTILVPAPEPQFEGQMIRVRDCAGPEWLQLLRKKELTRVRRCDIKEALIRMRDKGYYFHSRYIRLCLDVMTGKLKEDM